LDNWFLAAFGPPIAYRGDFLAHTPREGESPSSSDTFSSVFEITHIILGREIKIRREFSILSRPFGQLILFHLYFDFVFLLSK
jgi:hypothetical protein